ncbi:MAG: hypothetical protein NWE81_01140 [Candidatus Bathyarchaeota archaeon]|nr:hypothetical protein [Candidatus Bathyarchaeota archaeon]
MASVLGTRNSMVSLLVVALGLCVIVVSVFAYTQISALQNSANVLQYANGLLQNEVNALNTENDGLEEQNSLLESQASSLEGQVSSLEGQVEVMGTHFGKLSNQHAEFIGLYYPMFTDGAYHWLQTQQDHADPFWPWIVA